MSLLTSVPNYPVDQEMPFLLQVKFDDYAKLLSTTADEINDSACEVAGRAVADAKEGSSRALLTRYVGLNIKLAELHTVLASAGVNNMWIRGEPGTGKTALAEELIRARTEKRLSSSNARWPVLFVQRQSLFNPAAIGLGG